MLQRKATMAALHGGLLNDADIQAWLDEKSAADLMGALYQILEPVAWADQLCTPAVPITTPAPNMFSESTQRPISAVAPPSKLCPYHPYLFAGASIHFLHFFSWRRTRRSVIVQPILTFLLTLLLPFSKQIRG